MDSGTAIIVSAVALNALFYRSMYHVITRYPIASGLFTFLLIVGTSLKGGRPQGAAHQGIGYYRRSGSMQMV